jgi:uroporphyrinogen decarboxylase
MPRRETLTGRERVRLALEHQETDRIPIALVCGGINPPALRELDAFLGQERGITAEGYLEPLVDIVQVDPAYAGPPLPAKTDIWGVQRRDVSYGPGSYDEIAVYPLASAASPADVAAHRWPDPAWFDYSRLPARIAAVRAVRDRAIMVWNGNIFETAWYMRGLEQMLVDVMVDEEIATAIMARVTDFYVAHFDRVLAAAPGQVDLVFTADDIGDQRGLLMPKEKWQRLIVPHHARLNRVIHGHGAKVIYHTDGSIMEAVDGLIAMGIDVLQALQFSADNMDPVRLKREFGSRLCFEGGVSVQTTLPFGTVQDVRHEVEDRIRVLGEGGGYILGPSHYVQAGTPPANVAAMFDTAREYYPF